MARAAGRLRTALLDVGGTIWAERWVEDAEADVAERMAGLRTGIPDLEEAAARRLLDALLAEPHGPDEVVAAILRRHGVRRDPATVRRAICLPARPRTDLLPQTGVLLDAIRASGLRCVALTNSVFRDADRYRRDFEAFGIGDVFSDVVSSVDVGHLKPHPAMFDAALAAAGCDASACVMIGNSETNDIAPASARGMATIRVAIEEPCPGGTAADFLACSLGDAASLLLRLVARRAGAASLEEAVQG